MSSENGNPLDVVPGEVVGVGTPSNGLGAAVIEYLGSLTLAGGDHDGKKFVVLPWQRDFIEGAFGCDGDVGISLGRANGKSCIVAGIATAVVDPNGPLHGRRREVVICGPRFIQSRILFEDVIEFLRGFGYDLEDRSTWRKMDSQNTAWIEHRDSGARVRCIGSDNSSAHGLRPFYALIDEPSQIQASMRSKIFAALKTGLGKTPGSRLFALGTRPAASVGDHWFANMLSDPGPSGFSLTYAAESGDPVDDPETWRKANPSMDHLPSLRKQIEAEAVDAMRDSGALASFQSLRLNMGTSEVDRQVLLDAETWGRCETDIDDLPPRKGELIFGVDLGQNLSMSAVAAVWSSGRLEVLAGFPHTPDLVTRARNDQVPENLYTDMKARGELVQCGNRTVELDELLIVATERFGGNPDVVVGDRIREAELKDKLDAARIPVGEFISRGMGYIDGSTDVRAFRRMCISGRIKTPVSLLMTAAMSEAVTVSDASGNQKLAKSSEGNRRTRGKDDAACAAIVGIAELSRRAVDASTPQLSHFMA